MERRERRERRESKSVIEGKAQECCFCCWLRLPRPTARVVSSTVVCMRSF
jgi:hypothetical protein